MNEKTFKTIDEQIEILKKRRLKITNEDCAKTFLLRNNYYRVSGYSLTLRKNDIFSESSNFQNIVDIYNFDSELRHILLKYIEIIEITFKSIYAYYLTKEYGAFGYLDKSNFTNDTKYEEIFEKTEKQKNIRLAHEAYLKHFIEDLHQDIPFWAYIDLFTISDISFLYLISNYDLKKIVAEEFGLNMNRGGEILGKFMHSMTILRNLCAHGSRLYNRLFEQKPSLNKKEKALLIKRNGIIDNSHLYGFIIIMRRILLKNEFIALKESIVELTKKYPFVSMKFYGFREDWKDVL